MASASAAAPTAHLSTDPASKDRWICIYPAYLNSRKTVAEGRRIPKEKAVDNPSVPEIFDVCTNKGLQCEAEGMKRYTRDWTLDPARMGRVRVQLKNSDGSLCHMEIQTRKQLFLYLGDMIPRLKSRNVPGGAATAASVDAAASGASASAQSASASAAAGGGSNKNKKKKKK